MAGTSRIRQWFEDRTGLVRGTRAFLYEEIPASTGWWQTLGSITGALLLAQILTGFLLALYYVPHPEAAYESVQFIEESVTAGALTRALHHWGASFVVVAVFFHMCRVFFSGAYKKPREMTWIVGLLLFILICFLALTGQLLPMNQEGYWAAKVGVEIAASAPIVGPAIKQLMFGGATIGALTLPRFYILHVFLLPALLGGLVVLHIYLLRKHGPARAASDTSDKTKTFYPYQMFKDMVGITLAFVALIAVAYIVQGPQEPPADPSDTNYIPRPEWYFMSHFQILRVTPGNMKVLATFVLPTVVFALLVALPWLDRSRSRAIGQRRPIVAAGMVFILGVVSLTAYGVYTMPEQQHADGAEAVDEEADAEAEAYRYIKDGRVLFRRLKCMDCHTVNRRGGNIGPDLSNTGIRLKESYLREFLRDPQAMYPESPMPAVTAPDEEFDKLVAYVMSLTGEEER